MDRRTFLALAAAALGTAGCTADPPEDRSPTAPDPPRDDPDARIRHGVAESEAVLIAAYRATISSEPGLGDLLIPLLRHHEEHLRLVAPGWTGPTSTAAAAPDPGSSPGSAPVGSPTPTSTSPDAAADATAGQPGPTGEPGPDGPGPEPVGRTLAMLADDESAAMEQRITACDAAVDPALARLLCLVAASEAQHAAVLAHAAEDLS